MFHLLPFGAGVIVGAIGLKLIKKINVRAGIDKSSDKMKKTTETVKKTAVSGLSKIEETAGKLKNKISEEEPVKKKTTKTSRKAAPESASGKTTRKTTAKTKTPSAKKE